jgi:hypothetical protein
MSSFNSAHTSHPQSMRSLKQSITGHDKIYTKNAKYLQRKMPRRRYDVCLPGNLDCRYLLDLAAGDGVPDDDRRFS